MHKIFDDKSSVELIDEAQWARVRVREPLFGAKASVLLSSSDLEELAQAASRLAAFLRQRGR